MAKPVPGRVILARSNRDLLAQLAWSKVLLAFDLDGTLAPIAPRPSAARLRERTRTLLDACARLYPCVVISGRSRASARRLLAGLPLREVVGNHGHEPASGARELEAQVAAWQPRLERALAGLPGVSLEPKGCSLAIHYRLSRAQKRARRIILAAAAELGPLRLIAGKQVVNLLPEGAPHKGIALLEARRRLGCDTAIYVGDDADDEDVFALDEPGQLLGIRVGRHRASRATFFLRNQREIDALLAVLVALRRRPLQADAA